MHVRFALSCVPNGFHPLSPPSCSKASIPVAASYGTMPTTCSGTRALPMTSRTSGRPNQESGTIGGPSSMPTSWSDLRNTPEGDSNMLDQTVVVWGSAHPHASHSTKNYPIQVAGGKALGFKHGNLHSFEGAKKVPLANLFASMLHAVNAPVKSFADSSGTMTDLMA